MSLTGKEIKEEYLIKLILKSIIFQEAVFNDGKWCLDIDTEMSIVDLDNRKNETFIRFKNTDMRALFENYKSFIVKNNLSLAEAFVINYNNFSELLLLEFEEEITLIFDYIKKLS